MPASRLFLRLHRQGRPRHLPGGHHCGRARQQYRHRLGRFPPPGTSACCRCSSSAPRWTAHAAYAAVAIVHAAFNLLHPHHRARVINASWHVAPGDAGLETLKWAIVFAKEFFDCLVVFAAGNDGTDNEIYPDLSGELQQRSPARRQRDHGAGERPLRCQGVLLQLRKEHHPDRGARHAHPDDGALPGEPAALCRIQRHLGRGGLRHGGRGARLRPQSGLVGPGRDPAPDGIGRDDRRC